MFITENDFLVRNFTTTKYYMKHFIKITCFIWDVLIGTFSFLLLFFLLVFISINIWVQLTWLNLRIFFDIKILIFHIPLCCFQTLYVNSSDVVFTLEKGFWGLSVWFSSGGRGFEEGLRSERVETSSHSDTACKTNLQGQLAILLGGAH